MSEELLTIADYQEIARKILNASFPRVCSDVMKHVDKFDEVVSAIMMADHKFDGRGDKYGYRKQRVIWTIKKLYGPQPKKTLSLNHTGSNDVEMLEGVAAKPDFDIVEFKDDISYLNERVTASKTLTEKEKFCILEYLVHDKSLAEIADHFDIQKKSVLCNVRNGLTKLGIFNGYSKRLRRRAKRRRKNSQHIKDNGI